MNKPHRYSDRCRWAKLVFAAAMFFSLQGCPEPLRDTGGNGNGDPGLAVVCSDFASSAVTLLNPQADVVTAPLLIHSGSRPPQLQTALSGDLALPNVAPSDGSVVLIDRHPNAVVTVVAPRDGRVTEQFSVATGFPANPHDVLQLADGRWLVTRHESNPTPKRADGLDLGDDILVLSADGTPMSRIAMADTGSGGDPTGRPDRFYRWPDGSIWLTLNRVSLDWVTYSEGQIGVLEGTAAGEEVVLAKRITVQGRRNCGGIAPGPTVQRVTGAVADVELELELGAAPTVVVTCAGAFQIEVGGFDPDGSALVVLDESGKTLAALSGDDPRIQGVFSPAVATDGEGRILGATYGDNFGKGDRVVRWDPAEDSVEVVYTASKPWVIWALSRAADGAALVADATPSAPKLCRLGSQTTCLNPCSNTGLPPLAVAPHHESP